MLPSLPPRPSRADLRAHLVATAIAGEVATGRAENLRNIRRFVRGLPKYRFGLSDATAAGWDEARVLALMAERCGVSPDPGFHDGVDTIDPDLTIDRSSELGDRLALAARRRERVLLATGHPTGTLQMHLALAAALRAAGAHVVAVPGEPRVPVEGHRWSVRQLGDVCMVTDRGDLEHTHLGEPLRAVLAALDAAGEPPPDLVVADHGWAGAAGQDGLDAVGFADCNDPALFVAEAEGLVEVCVPLDDNVDPRAYDLLSAWVLGRGLAGAGESAGAEG